MDTTANCAHKAEAFGKIIATHAQDIAHRLGLVPAANSSPTLYVDGRSSSFETETGVTIHFKGISARKSRLAGASQIAQAILALWSVKKQGWIERAIMKATHQFNRLDNDIFRTWQRWMPSWLARHVPPRPSVFMPAFNNRKNFEPQPLPS